MGRPVHEFGADSVLGEFGLGHSGKPGVYNTVPNDPDSLIAWDESHSMPALGNRDLPVFHYRDQILQSVRENPVTIVVAETGAGKSTQVPQFLLDADYANVFLTQPRRAAARNVYMRIRAEIGEVRGHFAGEDLVSYQTAGDSEGQKDARIKIVTDGLQLVKELHDKGVQERDVLIIDEAHEWNSNVEVLVGWSKQALAANPRLRIVLMSATMDAQDLANYYEEVCPTRPPIIEVPGRMFDVKRYELIDSTVVNEVMKIIPQTLGKDDPADNEPKGILVFEPGKREIQETISEIQRRLGKEYGGRVKIFPLHAKLSREEQQAALAEYPGYTKIVVATDVAQTSLTIPDIKYIVDSGYKRSLEIDHEGTPSLRLIPISQADCDQRAGRAGRVSDGVYILTKLNDGTRHILYCNRDRYPVPEILRTDVARNTLRLGALELDIAKFDLLHKASGEVIRLAKANLGILGALDEQGRITPLGSQMNDYPLCTSSARIMVEAGRYHERTRAYLSAIVAAKEAGGLQYFVNNAGKRWQELTSEEESDLLVQLDLFIAAQNMSIGEMREFDLDVENIMKAREIFAKVSRLSGATEGELEPPTEQEREDIRLCTYIGFLTSIYKYVGDGGYVHAFNNWPTVREMSNRSSVTNGPAFIIGDPYNIDISRGDESGTRHCIETISSVTARQLGSVAAQHTTWVSEELEMRGGKLKERRRQFLFGTIDLGITEERPVEPSPVVREKVIAYALANPGDAQTELRAIKGTLEELGHLAKDRVPQLTHDRMVEIIHSIAPEEITNPSEIEDKLRMLLHDPKSGLTLDSLVSPERRERIFKNAPKTIEIGEVKLSLRYRNSVPIVRSFKPEDIPKLTDEILLEDGRHVLFSVRGESKKYTLYELKAKLALDQLVANQSK